MHNILCYSDIFESLFAFINCNHICMIKCMFSVSLKILFLTQVWARHGHVVAVTFILKTNCKCLKKSIIGAIIGIIVKVSVRLVRASGLVPIGKVPFGPESGRIWKQNGQIHFLTQNIICFGEKRIFFISNHHLVCWQIHLSW